MSQHTTVSVHTNNIRNELTNSHEPATHHNVSGPPAFMLSAISVQQSCELLRCERHYSRIEPPPHTIVYIPFRRHFL
jgi:hypothetical protein